MTTEEIIVELIANGYTMTEESGGGTDYYTVLISWYSPTGELVGESLMYSQYAVEQAYKHYSETDIGRENILIKNGYQKKSRVEKFQVVSWIKEDSIDIFCWIAPDGTVFENLFEELALKAAWIHLNTINREVLNVAYLRFVESNDGKNLSMDLILLNGTLLDRVSVVLGNSDLRAAYHGLFLHHEELLHYIVEKPYIFFVLKDNTIKSEADILYSSTSSSLEFEDVIEIVLNKDGLDGYLLACHVFDPNADLEMSAEQKLASYMWERHAKKIVNQLIMDRIILSGIASVGLEREGE